MQGSLTYPVFHCLRVIIKRFPLPVCTTSQPTSNSRSRSTTTASDDKKDYANGPSGAPFQITDNAPPSPFHYIVSQFLLHVTASSFASGARSSKLPLPLSTPQSITYPSTQVLWTDFTSTTISPSRVPAILLRPLALCDTSRYYAHTSIAACWSCTGDNLAVLFLSDSTSRRSSFPKYVSTFAYLLFIISPDDGYRGASEEPRSRDRRAKNINSIRRAAEVDWLSTLVIFI